MLYIYIALAAMMMLYAHLLGKLGVQRFTFSHVLCICFGVYVMSEWLHINALAIVIAAFLFPLLVLILLRGVRRRRT